MVADCSDLQCFRVLVAWTLGVLPGPSVPKWKIYAALSNAGAAVVLGQMCRAIGLSTQVAARGPVAVKGLPEPMEVYALTGASAPAEARIR